MVREAWKRVHPVHKKVVQKTNLRKQCCERDFHHHHRGIRSGDDPCIYLNLQRLGSRLASLSAGSRTPN